MEGGTARGWQPWGRGVCWEEAQSRGLSWEAWQAYVRECRERQALEIGFLDWRAWQDSEASRESVERKWMGKEEGVWGEVEALRRRQVQIRRKAEEERRKAELKMMEEEVEDENQCYMDWEAFLELEAREAMEREDFDVRPGPGTGGAMRRKAMRRWTS